MFELDPVLARDSILVGCFPLCQLRLINDTQFPWFLLVPQVEGIREIHHLTKEQQTQLMAESCQLAEMLETTFTATKINVAALGNMVPQLHVHHIVRYDTDPCWPGPVWGRLPVIPYDEKNLATILQKVRTLLHDDLVVQGI